MPGIAGVIGAGSGEERVRTAERMTEVMRHEPFYASGTYAVARLGIAAGWVVHRGSFADGNPVWNARGDVGLILCGEEYTNEWLERSRTVPAGQPNAAAASYLVHWYEELGPPFLARLNGIFSGILIDLRQDRVLLFNDRYGLGRVYVHEHASAVHFASEAKALLRVLPTTRALDERALAEYASCGCVLENRTLFSGVTLLPPASIWSFSRGHLLEKSTYFDINAWESQPRLSESDFDNALEDTFARILPRYFRGPQQVAMSLTGGLDGRMIMAAGRFDYGTLPCYTFGGPYRDCRDVVLARQVARICGQPHNVIHVKPDFFGDFPALAEQAVYLSDGAMDVSGSVELYVNRLARSIAPVRMTGNYGSEILRGNVAFKPQPLSPALFDHEYVRLGDKAAKTYEQAARIPRLSFIAFRQVPWHHHSRLALEQSQLTMRSPYLDNDLVALAYRIPLEMELSKRPALRFIAKTHAGLGAIPTDRGLVYREKPVRTKLAYLIQEFTFRAEYAYDYGMPAWLARVDHVLAPLRLERLFLGRHKFYHFRIWYRDALSAHVRDILLDPRARQRGHVRQGSLEKLVAAHISGKSNVTTELHQALSIELIYRTLIERSY